MRHNQTPPRYIIQGQSCESRVVAVSKKRQLLCGRAEHGRASQRSTDGRNPDLSPVSCTFVPKGPRLQQSVTFRVMRTAADNGYPISHVCGEGHREPRLDK